MNIRNIWFNIRLIASLVLLGGLARAESIGISTSKDATDQERLAAQEVRRYVYLRTGALPGQTEQQGTVVVAQKNSPALTHEAVRTASRDLQAQQYVLKTTTSGGKRTWWIVGGDDIGTLYGAYRFAEKLGVRFYLHGDVIPDERLTAIPDMDETGKPLFALRGINPWGSHPFGFDAWSTEDYKVIFSQLAKMRMNFLGIHCYPEGHPYAEPTVWVGTKSDFDVQGQVTFSYPSRYYSTLSKPAWGGYVPKKTSNYCFGGSLLFQDDAWAPEVMRGYCPVPETPEACNDVFNLMAAQFRDAFSFARELGVKTCVGTESPMTLPKVLRERLAQQGKNPDAPAVVREIYEGMFRRIAASHQLDYFWIWTPEGWTWGGNKPEQYTNTVRDVKLAVEALKASGAPFKLATCGWVLGPQHDRAAFDADLPKEIPMSAISRNTGATPVDPAFKNIAGRDTWAIPWLESDNREGLAGVQLFVGRMRRDAADALAYGCTGLMGLQWRTDILGPNVSALAEAAWTQAGWNPTLGKPQEVMPVPTTEGAQGGKRFPYLPCNDFYADWARVNFGLEDIGTVFAKIDGKVPSLSDGGCPSGGLKPVTKPWSEILPSFDFIKELETFRPRITGAGNLDRFDYWLNTFRYLRAIAEVRCVLAKPDPQELTRLYTEAYNALLRSVRTPGGLAMVVNMENNSTWFSTVSKVASRPWPNTYELEPRIIVPTLRSSVRKDEALRLTFIVLQEQPPAEVTLLWRPLGVGECRRVEVQHLVRATYHVTLPQSAESFEYRLEAKTADGKTILWPATAPAMNQTVVVW
jgi:hypothetical protein